MFKFILPLILFAITSCSFAAIYANSTSQAQSLAGLQEIAVAKNRYIVELEPAKIPVTSKYQQRVSANIKAQAQLVTHIEKIASNAVRKKFSHVLNALSVRLTTTQKQQLALNPAVKKITPVYIYKKALSNSAQLLNADIMWQQAQIQGPLAGETIKIAVLDSGINSLNPMFDDQGLPEYDNSGNDDYCIKDNSDFCNNKIIIARSYLPDFSIATQETLTPADTDGHGSHVAAIAAGMAVTTDNFSQELLLQGMAPGAQLMVYKILYRPASDPTTAITDTEILLSALEHAVLDGADIINNSWGGIEQQHPAGSPEIEAINNIEQAGILVVNAAGNNGELGGQSIVCPACGKPGLAVASTRHGRYSGQEIRYAEHQFHGFPGNGQRLSATITAEIIDSRAINENNGAGCAPYPDNSLLDKIVLVERGVCVFEDKAKLAMNAGAKAIFVSDNQDIPPVTMWMPDAKLPALLISQPQAATLLSLLDGSLATVADKLSTVTLDRFAKTLAPSSSRGPNTDSSYLKPEIAAPGEDILSAWLDQNGKASFAYLSGTSMATPQISGIAAALMSLKPNLSAKELKSVLTSTADTDISISQGVAATPFERGAGQVNLQRALNAGVAFDHIALVDNACVTLCDFKLQITNLKNIEQSWHFYLAGNSGISLTDDLSPITLAANSSKVLNISISVDNSAAVADWLFDNLMWKNLANDVSAAHIPVLIRPASAQTLLPITTQLTPAGNNVIAVTSTLTLADLKPDLQLAHFIPDGATVVPGSLVTSIEEGLIFGQDNTKLSWQLDSSALLASGLDSVTINYQLNYATAVITSNETLFLEENSSISTDLATKKIWLRLIEKASAGTTNQVLEHRYEFELIDRAYTIEPAPAYGMANLSNHSLTYQPDKSFFGADKLSLRITDNNSLLSHVINFNILVENINALPQINLTNNLTTKGGEFVRIDASTSYDDTPELLTYQWQQIGGTELDLSNSDSSILVFKAPKSSKTKTYTINLKLSDGAHQQTKDILVTVKASEKEAGTLGILCIFIMILVIIRQIQCRLHIARRC